MSNMLDQAIIDAEALKEAAIKNAEATIVEKYSDDIKKAVNQLLEQEGQPILPMGAMGAEPGTPHAEGGMDAGSGEGVTEATPEAYLGDVKTVRIPLPELVAEMKMDDLNPSEKQVHELVAEEVTGGEEVAAEGGEETFTIQESVLAAILGEDLDEDLYEETEDIDEGEELEEDEDLEEAEDLEESAYARALAHARAQKLDKSLPPGAKVHTTGEEPSGTEAYGTAPYVHPMAAAGKIKLTRQNEQLQAYQHNYAKLYESHQTYEQNYAQLYQQAEQLHEQNEKFRELLVKTQEKLNEVNVRNAQLHYTNRTLTSDSLNERQKDKIVEAIEKAGTVEETKVIFEALQSAVAGAKSKHDAPKSLNEAINRRSSAFLPRNHEETQSDPTLVDRMQKLAGIK